MDNLFPDRCDFLKIDVDGYEWLVSRGAQQVIERDRPILFLEYHSKLIGRHGGSLAEVLTFMQRYYRTLELFDVPNAQSITTKILSRYFAADPVCQIDITGIPEERLHEGRLHGTFWIFAT